MHVEMWEIRNHFHALDAPREASVYGRLSLLFDLRNSANPNFEEG
jgi:hypothetical protein